MNLHKCATSCIAAFLFPLLAHSATVVWNATEWYQNEGMTIISTPLGLGKSLSAGLTATKASGDQYVVSCPLVDLMFCGNWIEASFGDVVNRQTTRGIPADDYFVHSNIDDGDFFGKDIFVEEEEKDYLMFTIITGGLGEEMENPIYGWVEFYVSGDGKISIGNSAWDLDGGAMVVGGGAFAPIPEPASGLLLLLGVAGLALKRRIGV